MLHQVAALFDAQQRGVQAQIVCPGVAPLHAGDAAVIFGAVLIHLFNLLFGFVLADAVDFGDVVDAVLHVRGEEDADAVGIVPQEVVGAASNDDAASAAGKFTDQPALHTDQLRLGGDIIKSHAVSAIGDREDVLHKVHRPLVDAGQICLVHVEFFGGAGQNFTVVIMNVKAPGKLLADHSAAAAALSADGDDESLVFIHTNTSFISIIA